MGLDLTDSEISSIALNGLRAGDKLTYGQGALASNTAIGFHLFSDGSHQFTYNNTGHSLASGYTTYQKYTVTTHRLSPTNRHYCSDNPPTAYTPTEPWSAHGASQEGTGSTSYWWQHITYPSDWTTQNRDDYIQLHTDVENGMAAYPIWESVKPNRQGVFYLNDLMQNWTPLYHPRKFKTTLKHRFTVKP